MPHPIVYDQNQVSVLVVVESKGPISVSVSEPKFFLLIQIISQIMAGLAGRS